MVKSSVFRLSCRRAWGRFAALLLIGGLPWGCSAGGMAETLDDDAPWRDAADQRIEQIRKGDFLLTVRDGQGEPLAHREVTIDLHRHGFGFGIAMDAPEPFAYDRTSRELAGFLVDHFSWNTPENAMKWRPIEPQPGEFRFERGDHSVALAEANDLKLRGHALFWGRPMFIQEWVKDLEEEELRAAVLRRIERTVLRYRGKLVAWDVINELLAGDGDWFEEQLGPGTHAWIFKKAHELDPDTPLFVNEYEILHRPERVTALIALVRNLREQGAPVGGIGIQDHGAHRIAPIAAVDENDPNPPKWVPVRGAYEPTTMLESLDRLAELDLPIHLTEVSFPTLSPARQRLAVDRFYRIAFSHPAVEAILLWHVWSESHWAGQRAGLIDADFQPTAGGEQLLHLLNEEWHTRLTVTTDANGQVRFRGFHGTYDVSYPEDDRIRYGRVTLDADRSEATIQLAERRRN